MMTRHQAPASCQRARPVRAEQGQLTCASSHRFLTSEPRGGTQGYAEKKGANGHFGCRDGGYARWRG
jgi:hypothetical protein